MVPQLGVLLLQAVDQAVDARGLGDPAELVAVGEHQAYAIQQMMDFKTGTRNNDKGRVMRVVAERMTESEIKAVAEYLAAL